jgi:hypothetical protein
MADFGRGCILPAALLVLSGCAQPATVTGTVTWKGQSVARGKISFLPQEEGKGEVVGADIIDGKYTAHDVPLGKKRVDIQIVDTEIYRKPPSELEKPPAPGPAQPAGAAPPTFRGLSADVTQEKQTLDFRLPAQGL